MTGECKATAGMMGRFILQLTGRQAGHGPGSSRSQGKGAHLIRHESRQRAGSTGHKRDSCEPGHSFPSPAQGLPSASPLGWEENLQLPGCTAMDAAKVFVTAN